MKSKISYIIFKILARFSLLFVCVSFISFFILYNIPGNTKDVLTGLETQPLSIGNTINNLQKPFWKSYYLWFSHAIRFDLGTSLLNGNPVTAIIAKRWKISALLALLSFIPSLFMSIFWARHMYIYQKERKTKSLITLHGGLLLLMSFTSLTLSILLVIILTFFHIPIPIFYGTGLLRYVTPITVLIIVQIPVYVRSLSTSINIVKRSPFIYFSQSLGFPERKIWWYEILPNAFLFTLEIVAIQIGYLLGGTILIEYLFSLPGLGSLLVYSLYSRDIYVIQAIVLLNAATVMIVREITKSIRPCFMVT